MKNNNGFILGCNYWASNAGADMWRDWDPVVIEQDLRILRDCGVTYLRVFTNWRDFQPVKPLYGGNGKERERRMESDDLPANPYFLDEVMLDHFRYFCQLAKAYDIKLIVGLVTGWMSGRLYTPSLLYGKNLFTDPTALKFQQLLVKGMVTIFRDEPVIYAWDLGNECNCMGEAASDEVAWNWTQMITNAIKAADSSRPVISGMHSLEIEGVWRIQDQGEITDMLTTHPYPYWIEHCSLDPIHSFRTLLHATAQTQYYQTISGKPCLVEEIGTMGPMICNEEIAAGFLRVNLFSNWAHGAPGLMWWCANEQSHLTAPPYDWNMCERELGMTDKNREPKPMLLEMKRFANLMQTLNLELPDKTTDGVCILSKGQDHWGIAYMSYLLAKQAGITLEFSYCEQELPDSPVYLLPSVKSDCMYKSSYDKLKAKVAAGAVLYVSIDNAFMTEFEELTGLRVEYSYARGGSGEFTLGAETIKYQKNHTYQLKAVRAQVLAEDQNGNPMVTKADYQNGTVYVLNFPLESMLLDVPEAFGHNYDMIYREVFRDILIEKCVRVEGKGLVVTEHIGVLGQYAVVINYSDQERQLELELKQGYRVAEVLLGEDGKIEPFGAVILKIEAV